MYTDKLFEDNLPVLDAIVNLFTSKPDECFNNTVFVCVQHILYTTFTLINYLHKKLGVAPSNVHIMGKLYSTSSRVAQRFIDDGYNYYSCSPQLLLGTFEQKFIYDIVNMWSHIELYLDKTPHIKNIIIVDDGGKCITNVPKQLINKYKIWGIEQTSSGLTKINSCRPNFPVIEVASSAAKQFIESPMIAEAVARKIENIVPINSQNKLVCGVVGLGSIGRAVSKKLISMGHQVINYDNKLERQKPIIGAILENSLNNVINSADYIFGCAGEDITKDLDIATINATKCFISCSSQDTEYLTLLKKIENNYAYLNINDNIECTIKEGVIIKILRKGYPINFDNTGESVSTKDIQLTRGLLLSAIIQAISSFEQYPTDYNITYMLNPSLQQVTVNCWGKYGSRELVPETTLNHFLDTNWIIINSGGVYQGIHLPKYFSLKMEGLLCL